MLSRGCEVPQQELDPSRDFESLERHLGDPRNPERAASFASAVAADEAEEFPQAAARALEEWGFHRYYVPLALGGRLRTFEQLLAVLRPAARRDLTLAIGHGVTFLGCVPVWLAGSPALKARLAAQVLGGSPVALALTEQAHGADLLASEVTARPAGEGYRLWGRKWLINNATRAGALSVFARTDPEGGSRGFTFFLVEKGGLPPATLGRLPKEPTHGIRGADISGIGFEGCPVADQDRVGSLGSALEVMLKGFQITRTLCGGLSLGAGDTALRVTLDFALSRKLYGEAVWDLPHARRTLAHAFVDLLVADALTTSALRSLHVAPDQMSLRAAVVKYLVPTSVDGVLRRLSVVLGARHYLREGHAQGIFQKVLRDHAVVGLFDGSTIVNLNVIASQLKLLAATPARRRRPPDAAWERLAQVYTPGVPLPEFEPEALSLVMEGGDDERAALPMALRRLEGLDLDPQVGAALAALGRELSDALTSVDESVRDVSGQAGAAFLRLPEAFDLARRHAELRAGLAGLYAFLFARDVLDDTFFAAGAWLALALGRILSASDAGRPVPAAWTEAVAAELLARFRDDRAFSVARLRHAAPASAPK